MKPLLRWRRRSERPAHGTAFVEYSSLMLLLAIGAIAILAQAGGIDAPSPPPTTMPPTPALQK